MSVQKIEIPTKNLLDAVVRMPASEFERFVEKARKLRQRPAESRWKPHEVEIIKKINECVFSAEKQNRYDELVEKRRNEEISENELNELIVLTDESEDFMARRLENLIKLANSSKKSVDEIMEELEIYPPSAI